MLVGKGSRLLMIGDSITDCGRARPVGEGNGLGSGYVSLVNAMLSAAHPEYDIRVLNVGSSGNTVKDLKARWSEDVFALKPDWLSIMIGINDVWRQFDSPLNPERHVLLDEYEKTLDELVRKTKKTVKGLVLMSPYYIESNTDDAMRKLMDKYGAAAKKIAARHGAVFVDVQKAFNEHLKFRHSCSLAWDRVHPNMTGHMIIARAFLKAVGFGG